MMAFKKRQKLIPSYPFIQRLNIGGSGSAPLLSYPGGLCRSLSLDGADLKTSNLGPGHATYSI